MKLNIYVIYDVKAQVYNKPFYLLNHSIAIRTATDLLSDPRGDIALHPEDYTLFHIGEYEDTTATISTNDVLEPIVKFHELQNSNNKDN